MTILYTSSALQADIEDGNHTDAFLGHISESDLTKDEILEYLAQMAINAAERKFIEAKIVKQSIEGVRNITGGTQFETDRGFNLIKLAGKLKELK